MATEGRRINSFRAKKREKKRGGGQHLNPTCTKGLETYVHMAGNMKGN